jgi:hypothetical protein
MSHKTCSRESAVARAVRTGEWDESLQAHLGQCATCRSVKEAARWMQGLAAPAQEAAESGTDLQDTLPDPRILWLRAHLGERQAAAERAHRVSQWVEIGCIAAVCAALGLWLVWSWNEIGGQVAGGLRWAAFDAWRALSAGLAAYGPANAPVLFSSALALTSLVAIALAYPVFARD